MRDLIQNVGNVLTIQHQTCVDEIFKCTIFVGYGGVIFFYQCSTKSDGLLVPNHFGPIRLITSGVLVDVARVLMVLGIFFFLKIYFLRTFKIFVSPS